MIEAANDCREGEENRLVRFVYNLVDVRKIVGVSEEGQECWKRGREQKMRQRGGGQKRSGCGLLQGLPGFRRAGLSSRAVERSGPGHQTRVR